MSSDVRATSTQFPPFPLALLVRQAAPSEGWKRSATPDSFTSPTASDPDNGIQR
jgi:hypothetical protein